MNRQFTPEKMKAKWRHGEMFCLCMFREAVDVYKKQRILEETVGFESWFSDLLAMWQGLWLHLSLQSLCLQNGTKILPTPLVFCEEIAYHHT